MSKGTKLDKTEVKRIASWNVNGIRAACKSNLPKWLDAHRADIVMLQEVRAESHQVPEDIHTRAHYHQTWFPARVKKGYSGTGVLSLEAPKRVLTGMGCEEFDREGRVLGVEFEKLIVVSAYFPNSQDAGARIAYKVSFCEAIHDWIVKLGEAGKPVVLGGDFNIAPYEIDLARPKDNLKTPGFLPEERAWMDAFLRAGWIDTWRHLNPEVVKYSWWSARTGARARNLGWRIDFHVVAENHRQRIAQADMLNDVLGSDHCPVTLDLLVD